MELCKQSLLNVQFFIDPISRNFATIETEFKRINQCLKQLRQQSEDFKNFRHDLTTFWQANNGMGQIPKPSFFNQSVIKVNTDALKQGQEHHEGAQIISDKNILLGEIQQLRNSIAIHQINSQTSLKNGDQEGSSVLNDLSNLPSRQEKLFKKQSTQSRNSKIHPQQKHKLNNADIHNSNKSNPGQNKTLLQQIIQLREQLQQLQINDDTFREQIQKLQKENQRYKKLFGIKKTVTKQKIGSNADSNQMKSKKALVSFSKKSIGSQLHLENNQEPQASIQNSARQQDDQLGGFEGFKEIRQDIDKIRDYLNGKMKAIDLNFLDINGKIHGIERSIDILERTDNSLKQDIEYLEKTNNETKLNITELNQKSMQMSKSRFMKHFNNNQGQLNDGKFNKQVDMQERIIQLLDQMEKIKVQYQDILFGRKEQETGDQQTDPDIIEKRKKLALKLNGNVVCDEKTKKELSNCKRDLKKLRQQFDYLMNGVNTGTHQTKTLIIKPNQTKEEWKTLSTKINKFKTELQAQIKQLEGKITANNELAVVLNQFEVGIQECKILLKKKLDIVDFDKTTKRIEGRLNNFIRQTFEKQGYTNEQDAILTKQPWFCLSCDVQLKTYSGKMNKTNPVMNNTADKFMGKKVNPESHMVRRNENGRLPSIAI